MNIIFFNVYFFRKFHSFLVILLIIILLLNLSFITSFGYPIKNYQDIELKANEDTKGFKNGQIGDLNGDGLDDLILNVYGRRSAIYYQHNNRTLPHIPDANINNSGSFLIEDINKDNLNDVLFFGRFNVEIFYQGPNNTFKENPDIMREIKHCPNGCHYKSKATVGDINNDGRIDIVIGSNFGGPEIGVIYAFNQSNDGLFSLDEEIILRNKHEITDIEIIDINHDGLDDILFLESINNTRGAKVKIFFQNRNGVYNIEPDFILIPDTHYPGINFLFGNLNNDSLVDILVNTNGYTTIFYQQENNSFNEQPDLSLQTHPLENQPCLGNFNNDNLTDILYPKVTREESCVFYWYKQTENGELNSSEYLVEVKDFVGKSISYTIGDLDRSGGDDIVVFTVTGNQQTGYHEKILVFYLEGNDDDNDGYINGCDDFPNNPSEWFDTDKDGIGNNKDLDDDNDKIPDIEEDLNNNGEKDLFESDMMNKDTDYDGYYDKVDQFPTDHYEWVDFDEDGKGDNSDQDDDNDGYNDSLELKENTDPFNNLSKPKDKDGDLIPDSSDRYDNRFQNKTITWDTDVIITNQFEIETDEILIIYPGVNILFEPIKDGPLNKLIINGKIIAIGEENNEIVFTSQSLNPQPGDWRGIEIKKLSNNSIFKYCKIEYADTGIKIYEGDHEISNCTLSYNKHHALYLWDVSNVNKIIIKNNSIINNNEGIYAIKCSLTESIVDNFISNNSKYGIYLKDSSATILCNIIEYNYEMGIFCEFNPKDKTTTNILKNNIRLNKCGIGAWGKGSNLIIDNNRILLNGVGISLVGSTPLIINNTISKNDYGIDSQNCLPIIYYNTIINNSYYAIKTSPLKIGKGTIDAEYNYWGTTNHDDIKNMIDEGEIKVDFDPWIDAEGKECSNEKINSSSLIIEFVLLMIIFIIIIVCISFFLKKRMFKSN